MGTDPVASRQVDYRHPFLNRQLIAYIGNKRALLPFLHEVFVRLTDGRSTVTFLDPFAGSGAVSRLARLIGFSVAANDWEPYAWVINSCHLGVAESEVSGMFKDRGGIDAVLSELNNLPAPAREDRYISRHFAPRTTEGADWRTERLFYTAENAMIIDAIRSRIELLYPCAQPAQSMPMEKTVLLAQLLYGAATHTNTSGVFKACHRGFGGHGRDALRRIMAPIMLERPVLVDSPAPSRVFQQDAKEFLAGRNADICYLDPPYATHQYGSNYFMLNTIALWDKPEVNGERGPDGRLKQKAGIRADWIRTRSAFCYPSTVRAAFREVLQAADCRHLVVSYSDEGLIGLEELCDMLSETGCLTIRSKGYVKYPGGKQSIERATRNLELVLVVDRRTPPAPARLARQLADTRIGRLMAGAFNPARIRETFHVEGESIVMALPGGERLLLPMRHHWRFATSGLLPSTADAAQGERLAQMLASCQVRDRREEIEVLMEITRGCTEQRERDRLLKEILRLLNKFAHRKYREEFRQTLAALRRFAESLYALELFPECVGAAERFRVGLERVAQTAARRMLPP